MGRSVWWFCLVPCVVVLFGEVVLFAVVLVCAVVFLR